MSKKINVRRRVVASPPAGPSRVKQEFKKEVNINTIIAKMKKGVVPGQVVAGEQLFADVSRLPTSFQDAFDVVANAADMFDRLPLGLRKDLDHDPRALLGADRSLFEKYGLLKPVPPASGSAGAGAPAAPEGQGDRDLPGTGRPGPNKKVVKQPSIPADEAE